MPDTEDEEFEFLKWHPLLAGLLSFDLNLRMEEFGRTLVNEWGTVIYPAYLYNAIQQEGLVNLHWPDMDKILEFHGEDRIFFGGKPKDLQDSLSKIKLAAGMSPQAVVAEKKGKKLDWQQYKSSKGPRGLRESTVIADIFRERYCRNGSIDLTFANVEKVLNGLSNKAEGKTLSSRRFLKRRWNASHKLSPLQLLTALRERLIDEEPKLIFDYFGMHWRGMGPLEALQYEVEAKLKQYLQSDYRIEHEYELAGIIPLMFKVAIGSNNAAQQLGIGNVDGVRSTSGILLRAGKAMQEYLGKHGDTGCEELRTLCRNQIGLTSEEPVPRAEVLHWVKLDEVLDPWALAFPRLMT